MSMLDWNGYRQQVLSGVRALGRSPTAMDDIDIVWVCGKGTSQT
jgi:hypothetical protein